MTVTLFIGIVALAQEIEVMESICLLQMDHLVKIKYPKIAFLNFFPQGSLLFPFVLLES